MEDRILFVGRLLGARLFKKYWVMGGSFWNSRHMDPRDQYDVQEVRINIIKYIQQHINSVILESISAVVLSLFAPWPRAIILGTYFAMLIVHTYALIMQAYNWVLYLRAMRNIEANKTPALAQRDQEFAVHNNAVSFGYYEVSPKFAEVRRANEYCDYLTACNYSKQTVYDMIWLGKFTDVYVEWTRNNTQPARQTHWPRTSTRRVVMDPPANDA